jgi:hypothetical protein
MKDKANRWNFVLTHILMEDVAVRNRRLRTSDRRHNNEMPKVPFKDSNGATIMECRRRIPDRRGGKTHVEGKEHTPSGLIRT